MRPARPSATRPERLVATGGSAALSVRAVAAEAGAATSGLYSLFGSKEGLLVDALAEGAFDYLAERDRRASAKPRIPSPT